MNAKLYFVYGPMNCGKSLFLSAKAYNFKERGISCLVLKSTLDTRDSMDVIKSRALNTETECTPIAPEDNILEFFENEFKYDFYKWVLVDEAQFLTPEQVDQLGYVVDEYNINVICYGLRTDFQTKLFPGSKRLFEIADKIEEMKSTCQCGNKASVNARIDSEGYVVNEGEQVECGAEDKYVTLCRACYNIAIDNHCKISEIPMYR